MSSALFTFGTFSALREGNTFEAFPASLLKERFLVAVIRNMPAVIGNVTHWKDSKSLMLSSNSIGLDFAWLIPYLALGFPFGEDCSILGHLLFLDRR